MTQGHSETGTFVAFPARRRTKLHSTCALERLNKDIKRRADGAGVVPDEASVTRRIGAVLCEQKDNWRTRRHSMQVEAFSQFDIAPTDRNLSSQTQAA